MRRDGRDQTVAIRPEADLWRLIREYEPPLIGLAKLESPR